VAHGFGITEKMPRPAHRLDLLLVPSGDDPGVVAVWKAALIEERVCETEGRAGPDAARLVAGGFGAVRLDIPGRRTLYANAQGGFRVACPTCGQNQVPAFTEAMRRIDRSGHAEVTCSACNAALPLDQLDFSPPAAWGWSALELSDVASSGVTPWGDAWLRAMDPWFRVVARRVG
jgi:hypothetical protein